MKKAGIIFFIFLTVMLCGILPLRAQTEAEMRQYLFPEFSPGVVRKKNGSTANLNLNYNTVTQKMVTVDGTRYYDLTKEGLIDTIILNGRKFIPYDGAFYEVLVKAPFSLLLQNKSDLVPRGRPAGYGSTSQTSAIDNYTETNAGINLKNLDQYEIRSSAVYRVVNKNLKASFNNRNQFLKVFSQDREPLQDFIKKHRTRFEDPEDVAKLLEYYNEIKK